MFQDASLVLRCCCVSRRLTWSLLWRTPVLDACVSAGVVLVIWQISCFHGFHSLKLKGNCILHVFSLNLDSVCQSSASTVCAQCKSERKQGTLYSEEPVGNKQIPWKVWVGEGTWELQVCCFCKNSGISKPAFLTEPCTPKSQPSVPSSLCCFPFPVC